MTALRAVAWDIDGTLVDSEPLHHHALVTVCARYGLEIDPGDQSFVGTHIGAIWERLRLRFPMPVDRQAWLHEIRAIYAARSDSLKPIPGAIETVRILAKAGFAQICVSNSNRAVVDVNLRSLGITGFLAGSISLDDVCAGKPDPAPYRMAAQALDLPSQSVLAVEDSIPGMRSARAAGLKVALLNHAPPDNGPPDNDLRADYRLGALSEIVGILGVTA